MNGPAPGHMTISAINAVHRLEALARCSALDYHARRACESAAQIIRELQLRAQHDDRVPLELCHRKVAEDLLLNHDIDPNKGS